METTTPSAVQKALLRGKNKQDPYHPFDWYAKMRQESPVHFDEHSQTWSVFTYEEAKRVTIDKDTFSSQPPQDHRKHSLMKTMVMMDPPKHTRIRSIVSKAFTPRVMKLWEPRIQELMDDLIAQIEGKEEIDLVQDISYPLPVIVIAELLGVPTEHKQSFKEWSDILVSMPKSEEERDVVEWQKTRDQGEADMMAFFADIIEEKRQNLSDDLISLLIQAEEDGDKLSADELIPFCNLLLLAGNETTTNLISNMIFSLLENPGSYEALAQSPDLIPRAVEEAVRFRAPAPTIVRYVTEDTELGGKVLKKGDSVIVFLASANRDERQFPNAHEYDIHRHPNPHIGFGHGIHFCLGAPLARLEACTAIKAIQSRYESLELLSYVPMTSSGMYGLKALKLRVTPRC
ncbi:cytochrome P450 [Bacillus altitudinis]|uniref:cytochrome P450 n=1 Tax=Bacillus altitudinis TaxID=293387 RepID=UPI0005A10C23|nr:cytochrome P450 [Bacillus altitudinis]MCL6795148.1 cytochrome P450 [Bacillus altitudinis]MEE3607086.1 cytochrome P450 [Bacillus altitudinis]MEE3613223.1 cytochrome P450 [Bacillus altitudinis]MEE3648783.1 cytochrome P450 [Bacillus altitudinis]MEE4393247.1 cytochrome P450 [Bacillus altitudinis]